MFIDARTLPEDTVVDTDVCIVGAGAAGITLARECIAQPFRVCLLESGGLEFDQDTQSLYEGENIGHPHWPLTASRLRFFGGTTNHWSGNCRPLYNSDLAARAWIPHSGWPLSRAQLDPFYKRAQAICQLGPFAYDVDAWATAKEHRLPFTGDQVLTRIEHFSPPTRFGEVYRHEITHADNISTYLYANVIDIETHQTAQYVTRVRVACLQGAKFWVAAQLFILATGGVENARLLLLSNSAQAAGLGNRHDLVGRFFMEHAIMTTAVFLPSHPDVAHMDLYQHQRRRPTKFPEEVAEGVNIKGYLTLSEELQRRESLANFGVSLDRVWQHPSQVSKGYTSLQFLMGKALRGDFPDKFWHHLYNVVVDMDDVAVGTYRKIFLDANRPLNIYHFSLHSEQVPNPDSRVTLSTARDRLGRNRIRLDWRLSPLDTHTAKRGTELFGMALGRAGLGRLKVRDEAQRLASLHGGNHHIGTTRMHVTPTQGVVNEHCQVHGIANLFIAGSSVFPTSGGAQPTLTIVALAVRLADHVKQLMRGA